MVCLATSERFVVNIITETRGVLTVKLGAYIIKIIEFIWRKVTLTVKLIRGSVVKIWAEIETDPDFSKIEVLKSTRAIQGFLQTWAI